MNNLNSRFTNGLMNYVEAWFDNHPEPENLELFEFPESVSGKDAPLITVFAADQIMDTFMIKLTFASATKAARASQFLSELTTIMGLTHILINRNLFLFTDKRF